MTLTQKLSYRLFSHMLLLLLVYAVVSLLGAVKFLGDDPLATTLPYHQVNAFASVLVNLAVVSGLLGGGVYAAASALAAPRLHDERLLLYSVRLWSLVVLLGCAAGALGMLEGRSGMELPAVLDLGVGVTVVLVVANVLMSQPRAAVIPVWAVGMSLYVVSLIIGLLPAPDFLPDRVLRALALGLQQGVAYPMAIIALAFWLMHRFSNITPQWAQLGLYTVAGLTALAGGLQTLPQFYTLGAGQAVETLGSIGAVVVPVVYLIFAAHSYRAFSDRNTNATLSAHWLALGILLLLGAALLSGLNALPGVRVYTAGTRLSDLQVTLVQSGVISVLLGVFNQIAAELRGLNRRVTGLTPFWLVAFGAFVSGAALASAGLVQVYLERLLSIGYLESQALIVPLYSLWVIGLVLLAAGLIIYALGMRARRPGAQDVVKSGS